MHDQHSELTPRQLTGFEYTEYTKDLPNKVEESKEDGRWKIEFQGKSKNNPEIDRLEGGPFVVYFDLDTFNITNKESKKTINLIEVTPDGWSQKHVQLTSTKSMSPEIVAKIISYERIDSSNQEIIIGGTLDSEEDDPETIVKIILWNTLAARFIAEIGEPANEESAQALQQVLTERRNEVLEALSGKNDLDPNKIAKKPFN